MNTGTEDQTVTLRELNRGWGLVARKLQKGRVGVVARGRLVGWVVPVRTSCRLTSSSGSVGSMGARRVNIGSVNRNSGIIQKLLNGAAYTFFDFYAGEKLVGRLIPVQRQNNNSSNDPIELPPLATRLRWKTSYSEVGTGGLGQSRSFCAAKGGRKLASTEIIAAAISSNDSASYAMIFENQTLVSAGSRIELLTLANSSAQCLAIGEFFAALKPREYPMSDEVLARCVGVQQLAVSSNKRLRAIDIILLATCSLVGGDYFVPGNSIVWQERGWILEKLGVNPVRFGAGIAPSPTGSETQKKSPF